MPDSALTLASRNGFADWPSLPGWQRLFLTTLIVCLPVPMLAASGLAVPLPSVVYRVAVGVAERTQAVAVGVPGFEAVVAETTETARHGVIRLSAQERAATASASGASAQETFDDGSPSGEKPPRPVAGDREASATHAARAVGVGSATGSAPTEKRHGSASVASAERDVASPVTTPPGQQSNDSQEEGARPASSRTEEGDSSRPSPQGSDELEASPRDSSPRPQEPRTDTPPGGGTPEPPPAGSATPKPGSAPVTPPPPPADTPKPGSIPPPPVQVDTPKPGSRPVTPPGQIDTPTPGSLPVTPPGQIDTPKPGSLPVTAPAEPSGSAGVPELPDEPQLPAVPRPPRIPGRPE